MSEQMEYVTGLRPEKKIEGLPAGKAILRMAAEQPAVVIVEGEGRLAKFQLREENEHWQAVELTREVLVQS